jgi:hypothetical protein
LVCLETTGFHAESAFSAVVAVVVFVGVVVAARAGFAVVAAGEAGFFVGAAAAAVVREVQ